MFLLDDKVLIISVWFEYVKCENLSIATEAGYEEFW